MNTNPKAVRILCFGDSNTWGRVPGDDNKARFPSNVRWTGILQNELGNNYEVIEEGLNGRTTSKNSPFKAGKNGVEYLFPSLESHNPLDIVILSLGKNEMKVQYDTSPEEIGEGIEKCIETIKKEGQTINGKQPKIILVSPAIIIEKERLRFDKVINDFKGANLKSKKLADIYQKIANKYKVMFIDSSKIVSVGVDGVHIDEKNHKKLGIYISEIIKSIKNQTP